MYKLGVWLVAAATCAACGDITKPGDGGPADAAATVADADPNAPDADPNAPDADPNAPDATPGTPDATPVPDAPPPPPDAMIPASGVDLLFVIDDSGGMLEEQDQLLDAMPAFLDDLQTRLGALPSLHIGVVSTNLGAGPFSISGCAGDGDGAVLQNAPTSGACPAPSGRFIIDEPDGVGGRTRNYAGGTLAEAIQCIGRLGQFGCGFEQPLESMRRALDGSVSENAGFLRDDALLVVVILTNEDDCSASDTAMYDPSSSLFGPLSSFRCFEYGVQCTPDAPRTPGTKTGCASREASMYMYSMADYETFLATLKPAGRVVLTVIHGDTSPVEVVINEVGDPELAPSCVSSLGDADPAIRLHQLTGAFGDDGINGSLCSGFGGALAATSSAIADKL